jgi:hypothetical protein
MFREPAALRKTSDVQSGIFSLRDPVNRLDKHLPAALLGGQNFSALGSQAVITSSALTALFNPSA